MSIIEWLKGLFSGKDKVRYNLLIVRSKEQPTYSYDPEANKTSIYLGKKEELTRNGTDIFPENAEFRVLENGNVFTGVYGSGDHWAILTTITSDEHPTGKTYIYPKRSNNKQKKYQWTINSQQQELIRELISGILEDYSSANEENGAEETNPQNYADISAPAEAEDEAQTTDTESVPAAADVTENDPQPEPVDEVSADKESDTAVVAEAEAKAEAEIPLEPDSDNTETGKPGNTSELTAELEELKNRYADLIKELCIMADTEQPQDNDTAKILADLKLRLANLKEEAKKAKDLQDKNNGLQKELRASEDAHAELKKTKTALEKEKGGLKNDLDKAHRDAVAKEKELTDNFNREKDSLSGQNALLQKEVEELRSADAGKLTARIEELNATLERTESERNSAMADLTQKQSTIDHKQAKIDELTQKKDELNAKLQEKSSRCGTLENELKKANTTINDQSITITQLTDAKTKLEESLENTQKELGTTKEDLAKANHSITSLKSDVGACQLKIKNLNSDIDKQTQQNKQLGDTVSDDILTLEENYSDAAMSLVKAVEKDFLSECNPDAETDTVESMCGKIRRGVASVADSVSELKNKNFASAREVSEAYTGIIRDNIEGHAFTEITRWWAYSRLPFVANRDRDEGRTVGIDAINKAYAALSRMLALAGYRYQIPALFVENLNEGDYNDVTGKEQLNLDYQFPNVRTHAESIDRDDRNSTVIDIVQLGYYKGDELIRKTSVII